MGARRLNRFLPPRCRGAVVPTGGGRFPCAQQRAWAALPLPGAAVAGAALARTRCLRLGVPHARRRRDAGRCRACAAGERDFSAFRAADCQARSPSKVLRAIDISRRGAYWRLTSTPAPSSSMPVRNIMGCLVAVGSGRRPPSWMAEVLASRDRSVPRRPFRPTACTSSARTTMPSMRFHSTPHPWTGCPEPR